MRFIKGDSELMAVLIPRLTPLSTVHLPRAVISPVRQNPVMEPTLNLPEIRPAAGKGGWGKGGYPSEAAPIRQLQNLKFVIFLAAVILSSLF